MTAAAAAIAVIVAFSGWIGYSIARDIRGTDSNREGGQQE